MEHAIVLSGSLYCDDNCVPCCKVCGKNIIVYQQNEKNRPSYCMDHKPLQCKNCNKSMEGMPLCVNMKQLCRRCHTCYRCHDPIHRRDPAITSRVFAAWIGLRATRTPRPVIYMILRMAFTK